LRSFIDIFFIPGPEGPELEGQHADRKFEGNQYYKERLIRHTGQSDLVVNIEESHPKSIENSFGLQAKATDFLFDTMLLQFAVKSLG